jgi:hypothetical protein
MAKYRKKPIVIEAIQWSGKAEDLDAMRAFADVAEGLFSNDLYIETEEGKMRASLGDWIIKGVNGEFYPCKPDIFDKTYEAVEE